MGTWRSRDRPPEHCTVDEQILVFPVLASMLRHPSVMVGLSNTFWFDGTTVQRYQATALRAWAKLFHLPLFSAVNA
jgi:hypothetical protein